jgi:heme/copper-type cytochrome/quinol oxidase subunit 2
MNHVNAATHEDIAEINELFLKNLKPEVIIHTTFGPKHLKRIELKGEASKLLDKNPHQYEQLIIAIKTSEPQGPQKDYGRVEVDGVKYYWEFDYKDSTGFHTMPNGHRELIIALASEVED